MSKLIIPMSHSRTLAQDDCDIVVQIKLNVIWKTKSLDPAIEAARISINAAFADEARKIENDLREMIKQKPAPEINRNPS